jgi:hypothetical protein
MKANINIKPIYIVAFALIIFGLISTKLIINSNNNNKNDLALIVEQNTIEVQEIIQDNNNTTQIKLDGLASGVNILNENDVIIAAKIDAITVELGLLKEDVALIGETLENNQNAILIELEGLKSTVNILKSQGYNQVTPKQVIDYSECVAASTSPTTCAQILN